MASGNAYSVLGRGVGQWVIASRDLQHGDIAYDDGYVGTAIRQGIPTAAVARADRQKIAAGTRYVTLHTGIAEAATGAWSAAAAIGTLVWIDPRDDRLSIAPADPVAAGLRRVGRVQALPGQQGLPAAGFLRIDLDRKED